MASRTIDRLLLVPALIVLGSLTLAGCALLPGNTSTPSSSPSSSAQADDESTDDEAEADGDSASTGGCPDSISESTAAMAGVDGEITFIEAADFSATAISTKYLTGGCLFRVAVAAEGDGIATTTDIGYLPGDAATVTAISADLEAAGYTKVTDGIFTISDTSGVFVFASDDMMSEAEVEQLGLGDSIVIVMATTTGQ